MLFFQVLAAMRSAVLRSAGQIVRGQSLERLIQPLITLLCNIIWVAFAGDAFSVTHAVVALLFAHAVTFLWGGIWVRRFAVKKGPVSPIKRGALWREGLHLSGTGLLSSMMMNGMVLMIPALASFEAAGLYRIATAVALPLIFTHEVLGQVVAPKLAQHWHKGNLLALSQIMRNGVCASFAAVFIGILALYFFWGAVDNMGLWAGKSRSYFGRHIASVVPLGQYRRRLP